MIYRYIYKITCTIGSFKDKFYFGKHTTKNLDDGYKGSGLKLWRYYNRHPNDYIKEIISFHNTEEELNKAEYDIIHPWLGNEMCLNLKEGGKGGGIKGMSAWNKGLKGIQKAWNKGIFGVSEETSEKLKEAWKHRKPDSEETRKKKSIGAKNRKPDSEETRKKKSRNSKGNKHSLNHKWMNNGIDVVYPLVSECENYIKLGYKFGRL